jgi:hypothetical protein
MGQEVAGITGTDIKKNIVGARFKVFDHFF